MLIYHGPATEPLTCMPPPSSPPRFLPHAPLPPSPPRASSPPQVPLFVPCANHRGYGDNQDAWVLNPSCTSSLHISLLTFVGKLMGMSVRGKYMLNLNLPSLVWRQLVGSSVRRSDLDSVDSLL